MMQYFDNPADAARDLTASQFQAFKKLFLDFVSPLTAGAIDMELLKYQLKFGKILPSRANREYQLPTTT